MYNKSERTGLTYNPEDMMYCVNPQQAYAFLYYSATLYDLLCGRDRRLIFVFNKVEIEPLRKLWDEYKLECP